MSNGDARPITALLARIGAGEQEALAQLVPMVYDELRRLAARHLNRERDGHTLQPTALVHDAYLRMLGGQTAAFNDRVHFFAAASQAMRHILVDHARARHASKRGGHSLRESLDEALELPDDASPMPVEDLLLIDQALTELAAFDSQQARLIELRFFGGLTIPEAAAILQISPATLKREWATAKAWLYRRMTSGS